MLYVVEFTIKIYIYIVVSLSCATSTPCIINCLVTADLGTFLWNILSVIRLLTYSPNHATNHTQSRYGE